MDQDQDLLEGGESNGLILSYAPNAQFHSHEPQNTSTAHICTCTVCTQAHSPYFD